MKKIIISSISLIFVLVLGFIIFKNLSNSKTYKIVYYDDSTPGSKSEIKIVNKNIEINKTNFCSAVSCTETNSTNNFTYSKDNMKKLVNFIDKNFSNNIEIHNDDLNDYQKNVINGLLLSEYFFEINVEEYEYKIDYSPSNSLGYAIYFKNNNAVLVKKYEINDSYDITNIDTYSLNFTKENINKLFEYVKNNNSNIIYKSATLLKSETNIFKSITNNDESYLENDNVKLLYTISYDGIDCLTPSLYLYDDKTFEYYYTFTINDEVLIPKIGTYDYDISKIINKIDKYEEDVLGSYIIKGIDKTYVTYSSNKELNEFLKSIDVRLEMCLIGN